MASPISSAMSPSHASPLSPFPFQAPRRGSLEDHTRRNSGFVTMRIGTRSASVRSPFESPSAEHAVGGHEDEGYCPGLTRCLSHCWFITWCCCFLCYSSLPRVSTIADFVVTAIMYLVHVRHSEGSEGAWTFIKNDIVHYDFRTSAVSVVFLSFIRSVVLFFGYAYRFSHKASSLMMATFVMVFSVFYLTVKLALQQNSAIVPLLVFSLSLSVGQYIIYIIVRRKRIRLPTHSGDGSRISILDLSGQTTYQQLDEEDSQGDRNAAKGLNDAMAGVSSSTANDAVPAVGGGALEKLAGKDSCWALVDRLKVHYRYQDPRGNGGANNNGSLDHNKPQPEALVLVHGFGGSVESWRQAWDGLLELGLPVLAFDRPGFGLTSRPVKGDWTSNPYTEEYQVKLILRLMNQLSIQKAVLVGHSSGGALAALATIMDPRRVAGLVLISPTIYTDGFPSLVRSLFRTRLGREMVSQLVRTEMGEVALRRAWYDSSAIPEEVLRSYKATLEIENWDQALMEMAAVDPVSLKPRLKEITCPVLVLHGLEDKIVDISESKKLSQDLKGTKQRELLSLERVGHVPHQELPELFVHYTNKFLRKRVQRSLAQLQHKHSHDNDQNSPLSPLSDPEDSHGSYFPPHVDDQKVPPIIRPKPTRASVSPDSQRGVEEHSGGSAGDDGHGDNAHSNNNNSNNNNNNGTTPSHTQSRFRPIGHDA